MESAEELTDVLSHCGDLFRVGEAPVAFTGPCHPHPEYSLKGHVYEIKYTLNLRYSTVQYSAFLLEIAVILYSDSNRNQKNFLKYRIILSAPAD